MLETDEVEPQVVPDEEPTNPGTKKAKVKRAKVAKVEKVKATKKTPKRKKTKAKQTKPKVTVKKLKARGKKTKVKAKKSKSRSALGQLIVDRRAELEMSTRELADKLDLTPQAISAWENQVTLNVPARRLPLLAKALKLPLSDLQGCYFGKAA